MVVIAGRGGRRQVATAQARKGGVRPDRQGRAVGSHPDPPPALLPDGAEEAQAAQPAPASPREQTHVASRASGRQKAEGRALLERETQHTRACHTRRAHGPRLPSQHSCEHRGWGGGLGTASTGHRGA